MFRRLVILTVFLLLSLSFMTASSNYHINEQNELFNDIYYKIAQDDKFISEEQLKEYLSKHTKYDIQYNEKLILTL